MTVCISLYNFIFIMKIKLVFNHLFIVCACYYQFSTQLLRNVLLFMCFQTTYIFEYLNHGFLAALFLIKVQRS